MIANSSYRNSFVSDDQFNTSKNFKKPKRFIFKNANPREHRLFFASELLRRGLLKKSYFSWINRYYKPTASISTVNKFNLDPSVSDDILLKMQEFLDGSPYVLDFDADSIGKWLNQRLLNPVHYLTSYFTFVTETTFEDCSRENVLFVTEKVYQPIMQYHPFIVSAGTGFLDHMRSHGYETFPELFDESYDDETDLKLRTKIILDNIERVCNMPDEELRKIYYSDNFQNKLIKNRKLFLKNRGREKWIQAIEWLTN
jgi:hypothetical protein